MKILDLTFRFLNYACFATVAVLSVGLLAMWLRGSLDTHRCQQIMAIIYGKKMEPSLAPQALSDSQRQPSHAELLEARLGAALDADFREAALRNGLADFRSMGLQLKQDRRRLFAAHEQFMRELESLQIEVDQEAIYDLSLLMEALPAPQAKRQVIAMIDKGEVRQVVFLLRLLPQDRLADLLAQFTTDEDMLALNAIFAEIGDGGDMARRSAKR